MKTYEKFFIGGRWVASQSREFADVVNPASEAVIGPICMGDADDVAAAVEAASAAFDSCSNTPPAERAGWLLKLQAGLQARAEDIARLISEEVGTPIEFSRFAQAGLPIGSFGVAAQLLGDYAFSESVGNSEVVREAVGVVACITPWNYPLHQIAAKVAPALAAGCTVVLKPSEVAPLNAFLLAEIIESIGLPAGVFNLVCGAGPVVGEALARHPKVDMVSFTGSTRAGKRVSELASQTVKRVALELGGKSANILLDDADFSRAIPGAIQACYQNSGQTCTAHTRLLVSEKRYEEAAALAAEAARQTRIGDPFAADTSLGPLASEMQRERVRSYIVKGIEEGAELLAGGAEAPADLPLGYYVQPTVFGRVTPDMTIAREEIFGPVLSILTYRDEDDAVRIENDSVYGLGGGVSTYIGPFTHYAMGKFGKKLGIAVGDHDYAKAWSAAFRPAWEAAGGTVAADNPMSYNRAADFYSGVSRVLAAKPDVLLVGGASEATALVSKQARELGFKGGFVIIDQAKLDEIAKVIGGYGLLEGSIGLLPVIADSSSSMKAFVERYRKLYPGRDPSTEVTLGYTGARVTAQAMKAAASTTDVAAIRAQLDTAMKAMAPTANPHGLTGVDARGNSLGTLPVAVVEGGKIRAVKMADLR